MKSKLVIEGVETLKAESECGKLAITGKVDPSKLANKMKKKVDLISPHPPNNNKPQDRKTKEVIILFYFFKNNN